MKKYIVDILLEGLDHETRIRLLPEEQEKLKILETEGTVQESFIKLDMSGIFMVVVANDDNEVHTRLSTLPYYPYMKINLVPVRMDNALNR